MSMLDSIDNDLKTERLIVGALRRIWHQHPTRLEKVKQAKISLPMVNKDGSLSKRKNVIYKCELCGTDCKPARTPEYPKFFIDHITPVVPLDRARNSLSWDEYIDNLFCDITNLQLICESCHKTKTAEERKAKKLRGV